MTERMFSQALRRGLGSAVVELKNAENKRAYRDVVLRRCLRDMSYDWQSEGTRGHYLYEVLLASGEPEYYEKTIIEKFLSRCSDGLLRQLAAILYRFAYDGSEEAKKALRSKYDVFASKNGRLRKTPPVNEGYQWDEVVYHLMYIYGFFAFKHYATNVGTILLRHPDNRKAYDEWFRIRAEGRFGKKRIDAFFEAEYDKSPAVRALADALKAEAQERSEAQPGREKLTADDLLKIARETAAGGKPFRKYHMGRFRRAFFSNASEAEILDFARAVVREEDETAKALLLMLFWLDPSPLGIAPLMEYAQSDNALLAEVAIDLLKEFRDQGIHDLAVRLLREKGLNSFALALLRKNYKKADDALIAGLIRKASVIPHHVQQSIGSIYGRHRSSNAFPILLRVYRQGPCAFCRFPVVQAMHHCGVLPDDILEECLHDSFDDTRDFAKRLIKRRHSR